MRKLSNCHYYIHILISLLWSEAIPRIIGIWLIKKCFDNFAIILFCIYFDHFMLKDEKKGSPVKLDIISNTRLRSHSRIKFVGEFKIDHWKWNKKHGWNSSETRLGNLSSTSESGAEWKWLEKGEIWWVNIHLPANIQRSLKIF